MDSYQIRDCTPKHKKTKLDREKRRFRTNNTESQVYKWRTIYWCRHRRYVNNIKAEVDSSCPEFPPAIFTGCNVKYRNRLANFVRVDLENALLAQKIKRMSQIDNHLGPITNTRNRGRTRLLQQNQIAFENMGKARHLCEVRPIIDRKQQMRWYNKQEDYMEKLSKYPLYWRSSICKLPDKQGFDNISDEERPIVYFDFEVKDETVGRIIIELNPLAAPIAVEHFRVLCNGKGELGKSFKCAQLDKMWPGTYWTAGKGVRGSLTVPFPPKKFRMKHDERGILSLINTGDNTFQGEFMILARELKPLDDQNLAIGKVIQGLGYLESLARYRKKNSMTFRKPIYIIDTGELDPNEPFPPSPYFGGCYPGDEECAESEVDENGDEEEGRTNTESDMGQRESGEFDYDASAEQKA